MAADRMPESVELASFWASTVPPQWTIGGHVAGWRIEAPLGPQDRMPNGSASSRG